MALRFAMLAALLLVAPAAAQADPGDLDRSFAGDGTIVMAARGTSFVIGAELRPDGRAVVATSGGLEQFSPSGRLDPAFGTAADAFGLGRVEAGPLLDAAGRTRLITYADSGSPGLGIARVLPSGAPDKEFGIEGRRRLATPPGQFFQVDAVVDARGRIVLGGSYADAGVTRSYISRFSAEGELDRGFGIHGVVRGGRDSRASGLVALRDGRLVYSEYRNLPGPGGRTLRRTLREDGSLLREETARPRPRGSRPVATDRRGRTVVIGGRGRDGRISVGRLRPDGRPDRHFGDRGVARVPFGRRRGLRVVEHDVRRVLVRPDGRILLVGTVYEFGESVLDERPYLALTQLEG